MFICKSCGAIYSKRPPFACGKCNGNVFLIGRDKQREDDLPHNNEPLFIIFDGGTHLICPVSLICTGILPHELGMEPCRFSVNGCPPAPAPLLPGASPDKGRAGDLCPPCAKHSLGSLEHWQGHRGQQYPEVLLPLRVFKCRMWFWLVVPGLRDDNPAVIDVPVGVDYSLVLR